MGLGNLNHRLAQMSTADSKMDGLPQIEISKSYMFTYFTLKTIRQFNTFK